MIRVGLDDKRHSSQDHLGSPWSLFSSAGGPPLWPACSDNDDYEDYDNDDDDDDDGDKPLLWPAWSLWPL